MEATKNELNHNDYQHPQGMWHSYIGGKEPCAHFATKVSSINWCAHRVNDSNGINKCTPYQPS
jgi:hypothetical protein